MFLRQCISCNWQLKNFIITIFAFSFRLNRKAKYNLEKDLADKFQALAIDEQNKELKNNSAGLHYRDGVATIDSKYVLLSKFSQYS